MGVAGTPPDRMQQQLAVPDLACSLLPSQELPALAPTEAEASCEAIIIAGRPSWLLIASLLLGCGHAAGRHWPLSLSPSHLCAGARQSAEQVAPVPPEHAGDAEESNIKPAHPWRAHHEAGGGTVSGGLPQLPSHRD